MNTTSRLRQFQVAAVCAGLAFVTGCSGGDGPAIEKFKALGTTKALVVLDSNKHAGSVVFMSAMSPEEIAEGVKLLPSMGYLSSFSASNTVLTDADLEAVGKASTLIDLQLNKTKITDEGLKHLTRLPKLQSLVLGETGITPAGMEEIAKIKSVRTLNLDRCQNISGGFGPLKECADLDWLVVSGTKLTDSDVEDILAIPKLFRIGVEGAQISPAAIQKLKAKDIKLDGADEGGTPAASTDTAAGEESDGI